MDDLNLMTGSHKKLTLVTKSEAYTVFCHHTKKNNKFIFYPSRNHEQIINLNLVLNSY